MIFFFSNLVCGVKTPLAKCPQKGITSHSEYYSSDHVLNITSLLFPSDVIYLDG